MVPKKLILLSLFLGAFIPVAIYNKKRIPISDNTVQTYIEPEKNGKITVQTSADNDQSPQHLITMLQKGSLKGETLSQECFLELCEYLKETEYFSTQRDIKLMHELSKAYQQTPTGKRCLERDRAQYGDQPASPKVVELIRSALAKHDCPVTTMPIYQLKRGSDGMRTKGLTSSQAIWIDESSFQDEIEQEFNCVHEAGHWYYKHAIEHFVSDSSSVEHQEFEADEFALATISENTRATMIARAQQKLYPVEGYENNKELCDMLKPTITPKGIMTCYSLCLPSKEHAHNIITIARTA